MSRLTDHIKVPLFVGIRAMPSIYDVFISFNSLDRRTVYEVLERLKSEGIVPWIDSDGITGGEPSQDAITKGMTSSACCAVFISGAGLGPWQREEVEAAVRKRVRDRRFRIIPVILPGGIGTWDHLEDPDPLRSGSMVNLGSIERESDSLTHLVRAIFNLPPPPRASIRDRPPYLGLEAFQREDSALLMGRERLVGQLLYKLADALDANVTRLLGVIGASGSGKSSVVSGGIDALSGARVGIGGSESWLTVSCRPGAEPMENLDSRL